MKEGPTVPEPGDAAGGFIERASKAGIRVERHRETGLGNY